MHTGIDLGIKETAINTLDNNGKIVFHTQFGKEHQRIFKDTQVKHSATRMRLYHDHFHEYFKNNTITGTVVMEKPFGKFMGSAYLLHELNGIYLVALSFYFEQYKIFTPTSTQIKKFLTGHGAASKEMMVESCKKKGFQPKTHHEADAIAQALMSYEGEVW